ncbi:hypothetical protein [Edaphobacter aggregans]|uniref:hypothetical protein n=1 Tax=Edaphobacter aggregans TaxID=570835 RepID=UPI00054D0EB2|nr:hypothetical protein [Edaphobacter aggregans]
MTRQVNPLSFCSLQLGTHCLEKPSFELKYAAAKRQRFNQRDQFGGRSYCEMHIAVAGMPAPQTRLQAHKDDSVRVKVKNHDKGRIATNKAESRIGGALVADSLPCSCLFVLLLQPKAAL